MSYVCRQLHALIELALLAAFAFRNRQRAFSASCARSSLAELRFRSQRQWLYASLARNRSAPVRQAPGLDFFSLRVGRKRRRARFMKEQQFQSFSTQSRLPALQRDPQQVPFAEGSS